MYIKSIRTRLTIWYTCLLTVTLLIVGGAAFVLLSYSLSHEMDSSLDSVARALIERDQSRASTFPPSEIDQAFRRFFGFSPWDHYFQMRDPSGNRDEHRSLPSTGKLPLSSKALNNAMRGLSSFETVEGLGEYPVRILTMPVMESNRVINMIQVGMSLKSIDETYLRFLLIMAGVLPIGLVLAASGGWLLAHRALKPVDRMTAAARRISAEHLNQRVEETGTGDELDNLAKTLNQMLTRLDDAFSQVRRFSADASHELQTPLTILKGELEVVLRSKRTAEEYRETLESALEEVEQDRSPGGRAPAFGSRRSGRTENGPAGGRPGASARRGLPPIKAAGRLPQHRTSARCNRTAKHSRRSRTVGAHDIQPRWTMP